ncbi:hypothetical protein EG68_02606, partial [Paragonimus skrjabini miyazakii]
MYCVTNDRISGLSCLLGCVLVQLSYGYFYTIGNAFSIFTNSRTRKYGNIHHCLLDSKQFVWDQKWHGLTNITYRFFRVSGNAVGWINVPKSSRIVCYLVELFHTLRGNCAYLFYHTKRFCWRSYHLWRVKRIWIRIWLFRTYFLFRCVVSQTSRTYCGHRNRGLCSWWVCIHTYSDRLHQPSQHKNRQRNPV